MAAGAPSLERLISNLPTFCAGAGRRHERVTVRLPAVTASAATSDGCDGTTTLGGAGSGVPAGGGGSTASLAVAETEFPEASVAVKVTTVSPTVNFAGASVVIFGDASARSFARAAASHAAMVAFPTGIPSTVASVRRRETGRVRTGGVVSTTLTGNVTEPVLWCASVAVHVTVVVPSAKRAPEAGVQTTPAIAPSMLSVAVGFA